MCSCITAPLRGTDTYDAFFDLVVKIKKKCVVKNSAAAFLKLLELARIGLEQMMQLEVIDHDHEQLQGVGHDQTA